MSDVSIISINYERGGGVELDPSPAQREAGNYKKRHIVFQGIPISIENPAASVRRGKDDNGKPWARRMAADYGYIKRTIDGDNQQTDVFVGPNRNSDKVWVIDQVHHDTGTFDEHKSFLGFSSKAQVIDVYRRSYGSSHQIGGITETNIKTFKRWLKHGVASNPPPAFVVPHDVIKKMGNGDVGKAHAILSDLLGTHPLSNQPGGVPAYVVRHIGEGSIKHGKKVLKRFVKLARNSQGYAEGGAARLTKAEAGYIPHGTATQHCAACSMFQKPDGCTLVKGEIASKGWCRHFEPKS